MSDIQIVTGLSLLVAGFTQLRCGVSAFDWQVLVFLVFFSSLTHLACLTFLRNYLYNRPGERMWRVVLMSLMVVMLVAAMVPTADFDYTLWKIERSGAERQRLNDHAGAFAICSYRKSVDTKSISYGSMVVSVILLVFGLLTRVCRLYMPVAVSFFGRLRRFASQKIRSGLRYIYDMLGVDKCPTGLIRALLYRPLLAAFFSARVIADGYVSMLVEVYWLLAGFAWAMTHVAILLTVSGTGSSSWTFGQVIPVFLLTAPLLTFGGLLHKCELHLVRTTRRGRGSPPQKQSDLQSLLSF